MAADQGKNFFPADPVRRGTEKKMSSLREAEIVVNLSPSIKIVAKLINFSIILQERNHPSGYDWFSSAGSAEEKVCGHLWLKEVLNEIFLS
jgi:hypothetical protein